MDVNNIEYYATKTEYHAPIMMPLQITLTEEEKKYLLDEELGGYQGPFKANSEAAIANSVVNSSTKSTTSEFLHDSKERYQRIINLPKDQWPQIHFVMGNESADLDSIVSSILYAYLLNKQNGLYIPLLNIRREELVLRKDILYLFQLFHISPNDLLFLDDQVPLKSLFHEDKLRLNLVDHNLLRPSLEYLSDSVESIIDHHVDENKNYPLLHKEDKLIAVVGSATTLVAEKMLANREMTMTPELAALLLAPILMDTANLTSKEKVTERDRKVVESLLPIASPVIPKDYYEKLIAAKSDVSNLTPDMLLNKDFKEYLDGPLLYGISSLPPTVTWWNEDEQMLKPILEKFSKDHGLTFLILLMSNPDPNAHNRRIIVYSPSEKLSKAFNSYVNTDEALNETLVSNAITSDKQINYYTTKQMIARKQLQPLFQFSKNTELMLIFEKETKE